MKYPEWEDIRNDDYIRLRNFPMIDSDMPTFMGSKHAASPEDLNGADVVIIGAPYAASWEKYAGVENSEWIEAPKRVRQQSIRYPSGYIQDFDIDVFETVKVVDYGNAEIPIECNTKPTAKNILSAQKAVEIMVNQALDAGAIPIVIGQNSPCGSYAIAKPIAERTNGNVGLISLDTHWDCEKIDPLTMDPRIAGSDCWKRKLFEFHNNILCKNLVEIGERGMLESKEIVREFLKKGANFYPIWKIRNQIGIEGLCKELHHAYDETEAVYVHFDMDILGGAGPAPGDILGDLAEPMGMTDYEVIKLAFEIGKKGLDGFSFICIPPGSAVIYRTIVYIIMYLMAGMAVSKIAQSD